MADAKSTDEKAPQNWQTVPVRLRQEVYNILDEMARTQQPEAGRATGGVGGIIEEAVYVYLRSRDRLPPHIDVGGTAGHRR
jgi:hypothetical protein